MSEEQIENMARERRELAERLRFLDANVWLGRPAGFPLARELRSSDLGGILREHYVTDALVSHWWGKTVSPQDGNKALQEIMPRLDDNVLAIWTGLPLWAATGGDPIGLPGEYQTRSGALSTHQYRWRCELGRRHNG